MTQVYDTPPTPPAKPKRSWFKTAGLGCLGLIVACAVLGGIMQLTGNGQTPETAQTDPSPAANTASPSPENEVAESPENAAAPSPENEEVAESESPAPTPPPSPEQEEEPAPPAASIGQDVQVGDIRWKVLNAEDRGNTIESENEFIEDATTAGKFVLVEIEVENLKSEQTTMGPLDLVDSQGRTFSTTDNIDAIIALDVESCTLQTLNPNVPTRCHALYEVPADAQGLALQVGDLELLGGDEAQISLGF